jgi:ferric-dicitrate binding protein FerR (iron transport regulator)
MPEPTPCEIAQRRMSDLLAGDLDGGDAAALDRHLTECEECYRQAVKLFRQDRAFSQMAARSTLDAAATRLRNELRPRRRWGMFALVGSVAAAGLLVAAYFLIPRPAPGMVLEAASGEVRVDDQVAAAGDAIRPGQTVETRGAGSRAVLRFADSTRVELSEPALVRDVRDSEGKSLTVVRGAVSATVTPQAAGRPMVFATKSGEARVLGTTLRVVVDPEFDQTRLEVSEGKVQLTRWADKKSVDVPAGHFAIAADGVELSVRALVKGKAPKDLLQLDYAALRSLVAFKSETWANLPWFVSLHDAREAAAKEKKPIFMVTAHGHPLGYVGGNGIIIREGILNDPEVVKLLTEKFVLLAMDTSVHPREQDLAWLDRHDMGSRMPTINLVAFSPEGKKLASWIVYQPRQVKSFIELALKGFRPGTEPLKDLPPAARRVEDPPPAGGAIVRVTWKAFYDQPETNTAASNHEKKFQDALGSDRMWVRKDEVDALCQGKFPASLKNRIFKFHLGAIFGLKFKQLDLSVVDGRIQGRALLEDPKSEPVSLQGFLVAKDGVLGRFELLVRGEGIRIGDEGFRASFTTAPKGKRVPGAILFELGDPTEQVNQVPPHASKDSAYLK